MGRRKKNSTKKLYFGPEVDAAIVRFNTSENPSERERIYTKEIHPAVSKLIENVINVYKFRRTIHDIEQAEQECLVHIYKALVRFDPTRGTKAFSYFNQITKNFFIAAYRRQQRDSSRNLCYDDVIKTRANEGTNQIATSEDEFERAELVRFIVFEAQTRWLTEAAKENDKIVISAVIELFKEADGLEILSKRAVYVYLREITGLETKKITNAISKLKVRYTYSLKRFEEGYRAP